MNCSTAVFFKVVSLVTKQSQPLGVLVSIGYKNVTQCSVFKLPDVSTGLVCSQIHKNLRPTGGPVCSALTPV